MRVRSGFDRVEFLGDASFHNLSAIDAFPPKKNKTYRVVNFESFFIGNSIPRFEIQSAFERTLDFLVTLDVDCISIANNHSLDGDLSTLQRFVNELANRGIDTIGFKNKLVDQSAVRVCVDEKCSKIQYVDIFGAIDEASFSSEIKIERDGLEIELCSLQNLILHLPKKLNKGRIVVFLHAGITYDFKQNNLIERLKGERLNIVASHSHVPGFFYDSGNSVILTSLGNLIFDNFIENIPGEQSLVYNNSLVECLSLSYKFSLTSNERLISVLYSKYKKVGQEEVSLKVVRLFDFRKPLGYWIFFYVAYALSLQITFNKLIRKLKRVRGIMNK
ncbi:MAG: hypothetical protein GY931_00370 [Maribacter sp.]|nr:hypothetical protein [Maribacter sp.]